MLDIIKYKNEIVELNAFAKRNQYVSLEEILNVFKNPSEELLDDIEDYLESLGVDLIRDDFSLEEAIELENLDPIENLNDEIIEEDLKSTRYSYDPVKNYLNDIGKVPLLDSNDEIRLSKEIQQGLDAEKKMAKNTSAGELSKLKELSEKGLAARCVLIESNLRLVVSIAKHYLNRGLTFMDLIQEGNLGLIKAVYKFDPSRGFRFSTYGTWWIRQAITRAIADHGRMVRIPVHMVETINKLNKERNHLFQELQREPTNTELAKALGVSEKRVEYILQIALDTVSLDVPISDDDDSFLCDVLEDNTLISPEKYAENQIYREKIDIILKTLTAREEQIIRMRYGLNDNIQHTLEEIGKEFGITRERVRQIEIKAIRRLRHPSRIKYLKER